jgi:hypothetical protein
MARDGSRATITLVRGKTEKFFIVFAALALAQLSYIAVRINYFQKPAELRCERKKDECTLSGSDIFGGGWHWSFPASGMKRSEVRAGKHGESEWVIWRSDGESRQMGSLTSRAQQIDVYRRHSAALSAFIADRTISSFEARFDFLGGPSVGVWIGISIFLAYILFALMNGWRTTLAFDSAAGTLTITRTPALLPPARRTLQLADLSGCEAKSGRLWIVFASLPMLKIRLFSRDGKVVFKRSLVTSDDAQREVSAIQEILTPATEEPSATSRR